MAMILPRPPFDAELGAVLTVLGESFPSSITPEMIPLMRQAPLLAVADDLFAERGITRRDVTVPGHNGDSIEVTVLAKEGHSGVGPGIFHTHGGGMIIGDRFVGIQQMVDWIDRFDAVCVTVEYRLAPEFPDPYPVEDCYAGLVWTAEHAEELGIDAERLIIAGGSAGGGLAAGVALLARDRGGPALAGQVLIYPMIDDRDASVSTQQMDGVGVWDRVSNITGWSALLGDRRAGDDVSIYAAPARATDLAAIETNGRGIRVSPDGARLEAGQPGSWPARQAGPGAVVWIERAGEPHSNDAMVLERLAIAVTIVRARRGNPGESALGVVIDEHVSEAERAAAAARLRIDGHARLRIAAVAAGAPVALGSSTIVATPHGLIRAVLVTDESAVHPAEEGVRCGLGTPGDAHHLPESWRSAVVALRLSDDRVPHRDAVDLGAVLVLANAADAQSAPHPDVLALAELDARAIATLDALAEASTVRAAAALLGVHHSTVNARLNSLGNTLGYDARTPEGRIRFALARILLTLHRPTLA